MKKLALTLSILTAFYVFAYAGPEMYSGKDMKQVAPVPPSCPNWTGFYVGGFGGYTFGANDTTLDLGGSWTGIPGFEALEAVNSRDLDPSGFEAGGVIGYNHQFNKWVVGIEASGAYLSVDDSNHFNGLVVGNTYDGNTSLESNYLFTLGPRLGYAFCKWLPYITGGVAFGDIDFHQEFFIAPPNQAFGQGGSKNDMKVGWMVGGGLQYAIADHWSVRGQYQYVDLGSVSFDSVFLGAPTYTGHHEASLREHNASFAIIYGF
jgi:outer membrane immunogenic protein